MTWIEMPNEPPIAGDIIAIRHIDKDDGFVTYFIGNVGMLAAQDGSIQKRFISNQNEILPLLEHWEWKLIEDREPQLTQKEFEELMK